MMEDFDRDGYPTENTLQAIRDWSMTDPVGWFSFIIKAWHWPDFAVMYDSGDVELHTGGWSGNEDLIGAMAENQMLWLVHWQESRRGGHYKFTVKEAKSAT